MATACSSRSAASALSPIRWTLIPHQVPYRLGLALQEKVVQRRLAAKKYLEEQPTASPASRGSPSKQLEKARKVAWQDYLFLLEHTPVYTEGRRKGAKEAIADDTEGRRLSSLGADYILSQRGGLITFHGPGQIVGYPILDISRMNNLSTRCYVDMLQTAFRELLKGRYNIPTVPPPDDHTGVWPDESHKILSIGIQIRQRITSHGFALNVNAQPLLTWFSHIVACGIEGKSMTSIERELALMVKREEQARPDLEAAPLDEGLIASLPEIEPGLRLGPESLLRIADVAPLVAQQLGKTYERDLQSMSSDELRLEADNDNILRRAWFQDEEVIAADSS